MEKVIESKYLKKSMNVVIIEPQKINAQTKVIILLHGLGGSENDFKERTKINDFVDIYNIIAICPEGNNSWYVKEYYDYINEEVYNLYEGLDIIIAGFSMGGYGAMYIGLTNEKYKAIGSISGSIDIVSRDAEKRLDENVRDSWINIFGEHLEEKYNLFNYLDNKKFLYLVVGNEDHLLKMNRNFLENIRHSDYKYIEEKGAHNWEFVDKVLEQMICELIKYDKRN